MVSCRFPLNQSISKNRRFGGSTGFPLVDAAMQQLWQAML